MAEQSPVREEEDKWAHDPILRSMEASRRLKRNELITQRRRETTIDAREFAIPPEN